MAIRKREFEEKYHEWLSEQGYTSEEIDKDDSIGGEIETNGEGMVTGLWYPVLCNLDRPEDLDAKLAEWFGRENVKWEDF